MIIWAEYRGLKYGITRDHLAEVEGRGKVPLLIITPQSLAEYSARQGEGEPFLTVFVDAPDEELDARFGIRGDTEKRTSVAKQRQLDRSYRVGNVLMNLNRDEALRELLRLWQGGTPTSQ